MVLFEVGRPAYSGWHHSLGKSGEIQLSAGTHALTHCPLLLTVGVIGCFKFLLPQLPTVMNCNTIVSEINPVFLKITCFGVFFVSVFCFLVLVGRRFLGVALDILELRGLPTSASPMLG